jgi:hypothetical protein
MKKALQILCLLLFSYLHGDKEDESFREIPVDFAFSQLNKEQSVTFNHYCWSCFTGANERWVFQFERTNEGLNYTIWESPSERIEDYHENIHPNKVLLGTGSIDQQNLIKLDKFMLLSRDGDKCDSQCWSEIKIKRDSKELFGIFYDNKDQDISDASILSFSDLIRSFEPNKNNGFYFDNRPVYSNTIHEKTVKDWKRIKELLIEFEEGLYAIQRDLMDNEVEHQEERRSIFEIGMEIYHSEQLVDMINGYLEEIENIDESNTDVLFRSIEVVRSELASSERKIRREKYAEKILDDSIKVRITEALELLRSAAELSDNYQYITSDYKK